MALSEGAGNDNDFWAGLAIEKLPATGESARSIGCRFFFTGTECLHGHLAPRYTAGGRCVVCSHQSAERDRAKNWTGKKGAARAHLVRSLASLDGAKTYEPETPCKNGHQLRWVGTNNCIECESMRKEGYAESRRNSYLITKYGIGSDQYEELAKSQDGKCGICKEPSLIGPLHVDHCHSSQRIRGLLCSKCNQAIGLFCDNPELMRDAARYIENATA